MVLCSRVGNLFKQDFYKLMETETHVLTDVPKGRGLLYTADGKKQIVEGPFDAVKLCELIQCTYFQMVPATVGALANVALLLMDEEGKLNGQPKNSLADEELGEQVFGGSLDGNVLLLHTDDLE